VISIAVIFAIAGDGPIVARVRQKISKPDRGCSENTAGYRSGWNALLKKVPSEYHPILRERMDEYRSTIVKKILSKTSIKAVITEIQHSYAGSDWISTTPTYRPVLFCKAQPCKGNID
jgi:hypothetical protein